MGISSSRRKSPSIPGILRGAPRPLDGQGAGLLLETVRQIAQGTAPRIPQDHSQASYAFKLKKEDAKVEFHRTAWELDRLIRAMNPWPVAWAEIKGETVRIWEAWPGSGAGSPGEILSFSEEGLLVACGAGSLYLQKLQRPGERFFPASTLPMVCVCVLGRY